MLVDVHRINILARSLNPSLESLTVLYEFMLDQFALEKPEERNFQSFGTLITFDGHSAAGKDTQIALLKKYLSERISDSSTLIDLVQKNGDPFRRVAEFSWAQPEIQCGKDSFLLLTAGRRYFTYHTVLPLLENPNNVVLLNRSYLSHIAYHALDDADLSTFVSLSSFDPRPSLVFILECATSLAYSRVVARSSFKGKIYQNELPASTDIVKRNFRSLAQLVDGLIFVDTSPSSDLVAREISQRVDAYFER